MVITDWRGEYFGNIYLQGPAKVVRNDLTVDLTLSGGTPPAGGMPGQNWSARWTRNWTFDEGNYRFHLLVDDGARLWVGGKLLIDTWTDGPARTFTGDLYLKGQVPIQLDYYNHLGDARVRLNWERVSSYQGWQGSYYSNPNLSGLPVFQRDDLSISFNWGSSSPRIDLPADGFSVRWTRTLEFAEGGLYRFSVESDDGVRLWIDGTLVIDGWQDGRTSREDRQRLSAGKHSLEVEYYERWGDALIQLSWERESATPTPTASPTHTSTALPTPPRPTDTPTKPPVPSPTASPTHTSTPIPTPPHPTATPTKPVEPPPPRTATPFPVEPQLALKPDQGRVGEPFLVIGTQWPARLAVELFLIRPVPDPGDGEWMGSATTDGEGRFTIELAIPEGQGWEGLPEAIIEARSVLHEYEEVAQATYKILPSLRNVPFNQILTDEGRYQILEPTYLVLDSADAWGEWFGQQPPNVKPPINWKTDIVLGAFLGQQPRGLEVDVDAVVQRQATISVWLSVAVPEGTREDQGTVNVPRVMVRISRNNLRLPGGVKPADLVFAFLDANGQVLAQGSAGGALRRTPTERPQRLSSEGVISESVQGDEEALTPQEPGPALGEPVAEPETAAALESGASATEQEIAAALESEASAAEPKEEAAAAEEPADSTQAAGRGDTWFWVVGGVALVAGFAMLLWFGLDLLRRRRRTQR